MKEQGRVEEIKQDRAKVVLSYNPEICRKCPSKHFCGINPRESEGFVWAKFSQSPPEKGETVQIEIPEIKAVALSTVMFIVPIGLYVLAYWVVGFWLSSPGLRALVAFLPLILYFPGLRLVSGFFVPRIIDED